MGVALTKKKDRILLFLGILVNLGILAYFKYANFFVDNLNSVLDTQFNLIHIVLPLAVSFFTFQQIAYIVDAYRDEVHEYDFLNYSLFVTFFPQLIAGPIVHHKEMLPQFGKAETYRFSFEKLNVGLTVFVVGLFKKVVLADGVASFSTPVFQAADAGHTISFFEAWGGALAYSLQLYFDFSGYADMAIGLGIMFGIILPINFNSPYKSNNIISFWRRWHMTLSRFLKDYLYIPLGGNRRGSRHMNLFATMLLGGLWHGAAWSFVLWGSLHGLYLILNHGWRSFREKVFKQDLRLSTPAGTILSVFVTFLSVTIAWVFFRAETLDGAENMLAGMIGTSGLILPSKLNSVIPDGLHGLLVFQAGGGIGSFPSNTGFVWIVILLAIVFFLPNTQEIMHQKITQSSCPESRRGFIHWSPSLVIGIVTGFVMFVAIKTMLSVPDSEFLYFNF